MTVNRHADFAASHFEIEHSGYRITILLMLAMLRLFLAARARCRTCGSEAADFRRSVTASVLTYLRSQ